MLMQWHRFLFVVHHCPKKGCHLTQAFTVSTEAGNPTVEGLGATTDEGQLAPLCIWYREKDKRERIAGWKDYP